MIAFTICLYSGIIERIRDRIVDGPWRIKTWLAFI